MYIKVELGYNEHSGTIKKLFVITVKNVQYPVIWDQKWDIILFVISVNSL